MRLKNEKIVINNQDHSQVRSQENCSYSLTYA